MKVEKYAGLEDYKSAVRELDWRMYCVLKAQMESIKNACIVVWDTITKNIERIEKPRGSTTIHHMY